MTTNDLNQLRGVIKQEVTAIVKQEVTAIVKQEIDASEKRLLIEIGDVVDYSLLPLIEQKADKSDIDRLESKLDKFIDMSISHEHRIQDIEQIPVIAHQLKVKRAK